jgi:hypothetical protein
MPPSSWCPLSVVTETMTALGYPPGLERGLGVLTLVCVLLYAVPRTRVLGAILLTGLFGGAMATHLRVGSPLFSHLLFGVYLGLLVWGGLYLRDARLRALIPFRCDRQLHAQQPPPTEHDMAYVDGFVVPVPVKNPTPTAA